MEDALRNALARIQSSLDGLDARLTAIESKLEGADELRAQVEHERRARRELAEQTSWLVELLGDSSNELVWRRKQMDQQGEGSN